MSDTIRLLFFRSRIEVLPVSNYFNSLPLRTQLQELGKCRFMDSSEFEAGITPLAGKTLVIIGCGAQGFNQGLNLRDSGLNVSYALRKEAIEEQRPSWVKATEAGFQVGTYDEMVPSADMVLNLTPDKQHTAVVTAVMPLMKEGACLSYSHGFNIVEEGMKIREDLTVIMVAPKCPGTEVREEYLRGFGVPTLIAVHLENDPEGKGLELAKAYAAGTGGHVFAVFEGPVDFEHGDAAGDGVEQLVDGGLEVVLSFPGGGFLVVQDVLDEGGFFERGGGRLPALLGPRLEVERQLGDRLLDLVQIGTQAVPAVLHRVEQFVLQREVAATALVENPAEGLGVEVDRDRRQLLIADVGANDSALDSHSGRIMQRCPKAKGTVSLRVTVTTY